MNTLGFIGAGNMAGAIINGLLATGFDAQKLLVCDLDDDKLRVFREQGCQTTTQASEVFSQASAVMLAVKPQVLKPVISPLADIAQQHRPLIMSVVAAIPEASINRWLGGGLAIIRTMPNTPALVLSGATGLFANTLVDDTQKAFAESIFSGIGEFSWVDNEELLHSEIGRAHV